jgi:DNA-directed RNA polymerase specialized sigma24 family protein
MIDVPAFCPCPEDVEGCCRSLIFACEAGEFAGSCMLNGLKLGCARCGAVLLSGLYPDSESEGFHLPAALRRDKQLKEASEEMTVFGYQAAIPAVIDIFEKAYRRLAWATINRQDLRGMCDGEDVFQETFSGLHTCISKPGWVRRFSLAGLVVCTVESKCAAAIRRASRELPTLPIHGPKGTIQIPVEPKPYLSPEHIERWKDVDAMLAASGHTLPTRVVIATRILEFVETNTNYPAAQMIADWTELAGIPDPDLALIHSPIFAEALRFPSCSPVSIVAGRLNACTVLPSQIAVAFAAATKSDLTSTRVFLNELANMTPAAVHTRFSRACRDLPPLGGR